MIVPGSLIMCFDVESVGLHGEGFAVGWVVIDQNGFEKEAKYLACDPDMAKGHGIDRVWVDTHIPTMEYKFKRPRDVREIFWSRWTFWRGRGAILAADCPWPVEARFLAACVDDFPDDRKWEGPYPLIDVGSVRAAQKLDPLEVVARLQSELPIHNPAADARQSARLLLEAFRGR